MFILNRYSSLAGFIYFLIVFSGLSCSATDSFNISGYLIRKDQKETFDVLIARAEHAYDIKDYTLALDQGERALELSPKSERASTLIGYILLGLAGLDSFDLAKGLSKNDTSLTAENGTTDLFTSFETILGIKPEMTQTIGEKKSSTLQLFKNIDSFLPYPVPDAVSMYELNLLRLMNRAIKVICPFVDSGALNPLDTRHQGDNCPPTERPRSNSVDAHFVWAFSHFVEAVVYHSSVQFTEEGESQTNLSRRVQELQTKASELSPSLYVQHVQEIQSNVADVFDFSDPDSQSRALISSLSTVSLGFARLPGIPKTFTESIQKTLSFLKEAEDEAEGDAGEKSFKSMQAQLNKSIASSLSSQISEKITNNELSDEEKVALCDAHKEISAGVGALPEGC